MIVNAFKNGIFPLVSSDYTSDDDRDLQPQSPTSSFGTTDKSDKSMSLVLLLMTLIKYILVMLMILMNCILIQRNI